MPNVNEMLNGTVDAELFMHLTVSPLPAQPTLDNLVEASWPGYRTSSFEAVNRTEFPSGYTFVQGRGLFLYSGQAPGFPLTGIYITAMFEGYRYLLFVLPQSGPDAVRIHLDENVIEFSLSASTKT